MKHARHSKPAVGKSNICFECKNACGGCAWTEIDPETNRPRFAPVPGWTATKTKINMAKGMIVDGYHITECPLFERDDNRQEGGSGELGIGELKVLMTLWKRKGDT